jgi:hypothetical protein
MFEEFSNPPKVRGRRKMSESAVPIAVYHKPGWGRPEH